MLNKIKNKIVLWKGFFLVSKNWPLGLFFRIINIFRIDLLFDFDREIKLRNGIKINFGKKLDRSVMPLVVEIWQDKVYNPKGFEINPEQTILDIGANVGNFSLFAAKLFESAIIYALEPVTENFVLLKKNIAENSFRNILPLEFALAASCGTKEILFLTRMLGIHFLRKAQ